MVDPDEISVTELYRLVSVPLLPCPPADLPPLAGPDRPTLCYQGNRFSAPKLEWGELSLT